MIWRTTYQIILFLVLPRIIPFNFPENIQTNTAVQVTCLASEGDPPLDLFWSFRGKSASSRKGISTIRISPKGSILLIDPVSDDHSGNYTCTIRNQAGVGSYTTALSVNGTKVCFCVMRWNESWFFAHRMMFEGFSESTRMFLSSEGFYVTKICGKNLRQFLCFFLYFPVSRLRF